MSNLGTVEGREDTFIAGADLSSSAGLFVKMGSADKTVVLASAATDNIIGVLIDGAVSGASVRVGLLNGNGTFQAKAAGAITRGALLTSNGSGKATTAAAASAGAVPTTTVVGTALHSVANADSYVTFAPHKFKY
jgi:hypothetical protein